MSSAPSGRSGGVVSSAVRSGPSRTQTVKGLNAAFAAKDDAGHNRYKVSGTAISTYALREENRRTTRGRRAHSLQPRRTALTATAPADVLSLVRPVRPSLVSSKASMLASKTFASTSAVCSSRMKLQPMSRRQPRALRPPRPSPPPAHLSAAAAMSATPLWSLPPSSSARPL